MFTGIVEEIGHVRSMQGGRITIECELVQDGSDVGDSIAVNGCCLTVTRYGPGWWEADTVAETLARTTLGALAPGAGVNLERPVPPGGRLGGHIVQGHVDAVGTVVDAAPDLAVRMPPGLGRYVAEKGSIAVDGVSLTVVNAGDDEFCVSVIPHTATATTLGQRVPGDKVNIEVDVLAKYVERLLSYRRAQGIGDESGATGTQTEVIEGDR